MPECPKPTETQITRDNLFNSCYEESKFLQSIKVQFFYWKYINGLSGNVFDKTDPMTFVL